jgi:hypothetical protein
MFKVRIMYYGLDLGASLIGVADLAAQMEAPLPGVHYLSLAYWPGGL